MAREIAPSRETSFENYGDSLQAGDSIEVWIGSIKEWRIATFLEKQSPTAWIVQFDGEAEPSKKSKGVCFRKSEG